MTIATLKETAAAKVVAILAAVAMVLAFTPVSTARAATSAELEAQIQALLAQIASLQAQLGTGSTSTSGWVCPAGNFITNLGPGSTGAEVMAVQKFLNSNAGTIVATSGAGSAGMETSYYGPATAAAVMKFQAMYAAQILTPLGLTTGTPYWYASTRAQANTLCAGGSTGSNNGGSSSDDELDGGEASLSNLNAFDGEDTDLEEGDNGASAFEFEFDVEGGDARVDRVDVTFDFTGTTNGENDPWDAFDSVMLYDADGVLVAEKAVDSKSDWDTVDSSNDIYRVRLSNVDSIVREGDIAGYSVALDVANGVRGAATSGANAWNIYIDTNGVRARDGEGIDQYVGNSSDKVGITIDAKGAGESLTVSASTNDPDSTIFLVDEATRSDWAKVFVFRMKAKGGDLTVSEIPLTVTIGTESYTDVVRRAKLVVDGEDHSDVSVADPATTTADLTFDLTNEEFTIDDGDTTEVELWLEFNAADGSVYSSGETVSAAISATQADAIEIEGNDDLSASQISGSASGDTHQLLTGGLWTDGFSASYSNTVNNGLTVSQTYAVTFTAHAFENDVYIPKTINRGTSTSTGITYQVETSTDTAVVVGDAIVTEAFSTTADSSGSYYVVYAGTEETFTLTVTVQDAATTTDTAVPGFVRIQLLEMNYNLDSAGAADTQYDFAPASDWQTDLKEIQTDVDS